MQIQKAVLVSLGTGIFFFDIFELIRKGEMMTLLLASVAQHLESLNFLVSPS